jgi:hypothetical protein
MLLQATSKLNPDIRYRDAGAALGFASQLSRAKRVVSRSALGKQKVYYPRVSADAEDVRYTIQGFRVLIKNDFEV